MKDSKSIEQEDSKKVETSEQSAEINESLALAASESLAPMHMKVRATNYSTTLTSDDVWINCDNQASTPITVFLPRYPSIGRTIYVKRCGGGSVEIHANGNNIYGWRLTSSIDGGKIGQVGIFVFDGGNTWHSSWLMA